MSTTYHYSKKYTLKDGTVKYSDYISKYTPTGTKQTGRPNINFTDEEIEKIIQDYNETNNYSKTARLNDTTYYHVKKIINSN